MPEVRLYITKFVGTEPCLNHGKCKFIEECSYGKACYAFYLFVNSACQSKLNKRMNTTRENLYEPAEIWYNLIFRDKEVGYEI